MRATPARLRSLASATPAQVVNALKENHLSRAFIVFDPKKGTLVTSHPCLDEFAKELHGDRDFNKHEAIFLHVGPKTNALHSAVLHNTTRGPGAGGVRYWQYPTFLHVVKDGLRLSQGMGRKNALAGLWWGGGKGVIARQDDHLWQDAAFRKILFTEYGDFMTSLKGCYVTAEDLGVVTEDVDTIFSRTRFTSCISTTLGGSGNPSVPTALGVVCGMEGALDHLGMGSLAGKTVAVQGTGNVARFMIQRLLERNVKHVYGVDVSPHALEQAKALFQGKQVSLSQVALGDNSILYKEVDIVSPCATGGILNAETIPKIRAKLVCGAANNQLLDDSKDDQLLKAKKVTYVPDFLANRMGIVNCANEQYGFVDNDPAIHRHFGRDWENSIFLMTKKVLKKAETESTTTSIAANRLADEFMKQDHPIWPNRSRQIIQSLVANWAR